MTQLEAKVLAVNKVKAEINRVAPLFIAAVVPFLNKKVLKVGGFTEQLKKVLPEVNAFQSYRSASNYGLYYVVRECVNYTGNTYGDTFATYYEETFCFGEVKDGILVKLAEFEPRRCDYTAEEVRQNRIAVGEARDALHAAEFKLCPFGEYDS